MERSDARVVIASYDRELAAALPRGGLVLASPPVLLEPDDVRAEELEADLVVLDAGPSGAGLCGELRARGWRVPILLVLGRDDPASRVAALEAGADDCLGRPFAPRELAARASALLRRVPEKAQLRFADLLYDLAKREVRRGERQLDLTATEARLLELFLRNPRQVLPRELILERVWGGTAIGSNALEVYVGYLRRKLELAGEPRLLHTVRGVGYILEVRAHPPSARRRT